MKTQTNECPGDKGRRRTPKVRVATELSESLSKRLAGYALVAGAAGVGLLGTAALGNADIVYTKADVHFGSNSVIPIDLNHDGVADFTISNFGFRSSGPCCIFEGGSLFLGGPINNGAVGSGYVFRLQAGAQIPTSRSLFGGGFMALWRLEYDKNHSMSTSASRGSWGGGTGFIGLKFLIDGQPHYGWADLEVLDDFKTGGFSGTLISYAYETVANQPILAGETGVPEPGTLGLLALGSLGLGFWRRRKQESGVRSQEPEGELLRCPEGNTLSSRRC